MKQDKKEVASQQKSEMDYICRVFKDSNGYHVTHVGLMEIMKNLGSNGKLCRSRRNIYVALRALGYVYQKGK